MAANAPSETSPLLDSSRASSRNPSKGSSVHSHTSPSFNSDSRPAVHDHGINFARGSVIFMACALIIFLQAGNISMITTIQSTIVDDLDAYEQASWMTSAYLVPMSSFAPVMGRLSEVFSPRKCVFFSTCLLALGCIVTSRARTFAEFMVGRGIAGTGGAGVFSVALILVLQLCPVRRRGLFLGLLNTGYTTGVALGAIVAGALLPKIGWRALFWMQAPFLVLAASTMLLAIPRSSQQPRKSSSVSLPLLTKLKRLDYVGALCLTTGITLILIGISAIEIWLLPIALGLGVVPIFILNEVYLAHQPILPVAVLTNWGVLLTCTSTLGFMICRWAVLFYSPVYAIAVQGWAPGLAGTMLIPTNAGLAIGGIAVGILHIKRTGSFYAATVITYALFPVTLILISLSMASAISPAWPALFTFTNGLCVGACLNYTLAHVLHLTAPETHYIVSSLIATFRGFAGSFASAAAGGIFGRILQDSLRTGFAREGLSGREGLIRRLLGSPALVAQLSGIERDVAVAGYDDALRGLFAAAAGLAVIMIAVQAGTGWKGPSPPQSAVLGDAEDGAVDPVHGVEPVPAARTSGSED